MSDNFTLDFYPPYVGSAFSPEVDVTETADDVTVTITDARGEHAYTVEKTDAAIAGAQAATADANAAVANANNATNAANAATSAANAAATNANNATSAATNAAGQAATAAQNADTATNAANDAVTRADNTIAGITQSANQIFAQAGQATIDANAAAQSANDAATLANTKAGLADTAAQNADTATTAANNAATTATTAATAANAAAQQAELTTFKTEPVVDALDVGTPAKLAQGTWTIDHIWSELDNRVAFASTLAVSKGSFVKIKCAEDEKFAIASWTVSDGVYTNTAYGNFTSSYREYDWIISKDCEISIVFAKLDGTSAITPETTGSNAVVFMFNYEGNGYDALSDAAIIHKTMPEVYERKSVSQSANSYETWTEENVTRARVKKEYIQEIPDGAESYAFFVNADSLAEGKYKVGFALYTADYVQIPSTIKGWYTEDYNQFIPSIPSNAKYFMFFYATNTADEIDLSEIDHDKNVVVFSNSNINYASQLLNYPVSKAVQKIKPSASNTFIYSINHRGYSIDAPENTLPAFILSKKKGFSYVETDLSFTSDGVAVLLHDTTINRTARNSDGTEISGTVYIGDITYEQALTYDFGIWKGSQWEGTRIPTFDEFILLCKQLSLHPFIELKDVVNGTYWTDAKIEAIADSIQAIGMAEHVSFISFSTSALEKMRAHFPKSRLGLGFTGTYSTANINTLITNAETLQNGENEVIVSVENSSMTSEYFSLLTSAGISPIVWTINNASTALSLNQSVVGVLSDVINAGELIENELLLTIG